MRYVDARRFGRLLPVREDIADWTALGPDPLADGIDVGRLSEALAKGPRAVKKIVMDQRVIAGVGNILATEGLWICLLYTSLSVRIPRWNVGHRRRRLTRP